MILAYPKNSTKPTPKNHNQGMHCGDSRTMKMGLNIIKAAPTKVSKLNTREECFIVFDSRK